MDRLPRYLLRNKGATSRPPPPLPHPILCPCPFTFGDALLTLVLALSNQSNALQITPGKLRWCLSLFLSPAVHHRVYGSTSATGDKALMYAYSGHQSAEQVAFAFAQILFYFLLGLLSRGFLFHVCRASL